MIAATADVSSVSYLGGDRVVLTSPAWPAGLLTATAYDASRNVFLSCITGRVGSMYAAYALGQTLTVFMPQLATVTTAITVSVIDADMNVVATVALAVVPPFYASCTFDIRDLLPTNWARGATNIADVASIGY